MKFFHLILLFAILAQLTLQATPNDVLENDADAYDNDDGEKKSQKKSAPIVTDQQVFDEICTVFGSCYRDNAEGYKQCIASCPESECYKCRGLTVKTVCCLKF